MDRIPGFWYGFTYGAVTMGSFLFALDHFIGLEVVAEQVRGWLHR